VNPYVDPNTRVNFNRLGITDSRVLQVAEYQATAIRIQELDLAQQSRHTSKHRQVRRAVDVKHEPTAWPVHACSKVPPQRASHKCP
jgi:hypothetical protein